MNKSSHLFSDCVREFDFFERFWLQIKSMKYMFFIPLLGYYGIVPLWVWAQSHRSDFYLFGSISEICFLIVPLLSSWWLLTYLKEYIEGAGREVLLLGKETFRSALILWAINVICFLPVLLVPNNTIFQDDATKLFLQLLILSFLANGLAYFLAYYSGSMTVTMLFILMYTALSNYTFAHEVLSKVFSPFMYSELENADFPDEIGVFVKFVLMGVFFWSFGAIKSKRFMK